MNAYTTDIDALLRYLQIGHTPHWYDDSKRWNAAISALVAERDALRKRVAELESQPPADRDLCGDPSSDLDGEKLVAMRKGTAMESDTPRTMKEINRIYSNLDGGEDNAVYAISQMGAHSCELERELAAAKRRIEELEAPIRNPLSRALELEEALWPLKQRGGGA